MIEIALALALATARHVASDPLELAFDYAPRLYRAQQRDQFAEVKAPDVAGKSFKVTGRFADANDYSEHMASYSYKGSTLSLNLSYIPESTEPFVLRSAESRGRSYIGQNAFGAKARVTEVGGTRKH